MIISSATQQHDKNGADPFPSLPRKGLLACHVVVTVAEEDEQQHSLERSAALPLTRPCPRIYPVPPPARRRPNPVPRTRVLTPMALNIDAVTSNHSSVYNTPDSPPELDKSSSKSSSFRSSSLADATPTDISNFEDISLDDLHSVADFPADVFAKPVRMAQTFDTMRLPEERLPMPATRRRQPGSGPPLRILTNAGKPVRQNGANPNISGAKLGSSPGLPSGRRRGPSSPNPFLPPIAPSGLRPRSISPSSHTARNRNPSPHSLYSPRSPQRAPGTPGIPAGRRSSWQPRRKSVKELEDEYHDSDEELPEDAIVWNVPISPRPPHERDLSRNPTKHQSSPVPASPNPHAGAAIPDRSSAPPNSLGIISRSTASAVPSLPRSLSVNASTEEVPGLTRSNTKSWDTAMSDLSEDARVLTKVLEHYAEESEKKQEETVQNGSPQKLCSDRRSVTMSAIELPPVRKGDMMIDPLPCSKEKEKVLTRTRPSWLPPKDPKEEKKHLKQYQEMMALSLEAEKRRARKLQDEQCRRDTHQTSMARIWEQHVLPNWHTVINEPRTRELWWRGVTPRDRGTVWQKAVGNDLGISEQTYTVALSRVKTTRERLARLREEDREQEKEHRWFEQIRKDINEAFPELKIFHSEGPLHKTLLDVVMAYALYRSDIGYVSGVHSIAALLLLNLDAPAAFTTLANLLNRPIPSALLTANPVAVPKVHTLVLDALSYKIPALHIHLTSPNLALPASTYLDPILRSLFCASKFGPDIASRIMDVYVFENDKMLIRAAVGTLARLEARLYGNKAEILDVLAFDKPMMKWDLGNEDEFMRAVREAGKIDDEDSPDSTRRPR